MLGFSSTVPIKYRNIFHMFSFYTDFSTPQTYFKPFHSYPSCLLNTSSASVPAGVRKESLKTKNILLAVFYPCWHPLLEDRLKHYL